MAYQTGDLHWFGPGCWGGRADDPCAGYKHYEPQDPRNGYKGVKGPALYLPHSCDEWVIGGEEEIKALIGDLNAALERIKELNG